MSFSFTQSNEAERIRRKAWVRQNIAVLSEQLLAAREVFKEGFTDVEAILTDIMNKNGSDVDKSLWKERPSRYEALIDKIVNVTQERYSRYRS